MEVYNSKEKKKKQKKPFSFLHKKIAQFGY